MPRSDQVKQRRSVRLGRLAIWMFAGSFALGSNLTAQSVAHAQDALPKDPPWNSMYGGVRPFSLARSDSSFTSPHVYERFRSSVAELREQACAEDDETEQAVKNAQRLHDNGYNNEETEKYLASIRGVKHALFRECERMRRATNPDEVLSIGRSRDELRVKAMTLEDKIFHGGPDSGLSLDALATLSLSLDP